MYTKSLAAKALRGKQVACILEAIFSSAFSLAIFLAMFLGMWGCIPRTNNSDVASNANSPASQSQKPQGSVPQALSIVSFNGKRWGRPAQEVEAAAGLLVNANPDLVALQEVNTSESGVRAVRLFAQTLSEKLKANYCIAFSAVPSESRERYALVWRESALSYVTTKGEVKAECLPLTVTLPLFNRHSEQIVREPVYAKFVTTGSQKKFIAATVHLVPSGKKPQNEVAPVFNSLPQKGDEFANIPLILMGDFNLSSAHPAFNPAKANGFLANMAPRTKTSLKMKKREYNKEYDQFFSRGLKCGEGQRIDVYALLPEMSSKEIYDNISDHAPIHMSCVL